MVGTAFGRYVIESRLGEGGMGVVYRARDIKLGRLVAIKVLGGRIQSDPAAWGWLLREAQIASALNHPCICTIYDIGEEAEQPYIAMEYIEGRPLNTLLIPSGLAPGLVRHYGILIADALGHAHERGVIHRDIKGTNVVITPDGVLKILDFGLAKRLRGDSFQEFVTSHSSLKEIGGLVGTVPYWAPELLRGERANVGSDIWSLGVLLFEMVTGTLPFWGTTVFELTTAIMTGEPTPLPVNVPFRLVHVIKRCLRKDPLSRYHCARDVAAGLGMKCHLHSALYATNRKTPALSRAVGVGAGAS
jgi:serine/threonine protein kinase